MDALARALRYLLQEHEYVSLPGLGSFVCARQESIVDDHLRLIDPPRVSYQFSADRRFDDGALTWYVQMFVALEDTGCSTAEALVTEWISALTHELNTGRSVTLDGIGTLFPNEREVLFSPCDSATSATPEAYYESLVLPPARSRRRTTRKAKRKGAVRIVAMSLVLIITIGAAYLSTQDNLLARFNIELPEITEVAIETPGVSDPIPDATGQENSLQDTFVNLRDSLQRMDSVAARVSHEIPVPVTPSPAPEKPKTRKSPTASNIKLRQHEALKVPAKKPEPTHSYYVIFGSFGQAENALKLKSKLIEAGHSVEVHHWGDKHYVALGRFDSKSEAVAQRNASLTKLPEYELWVMTRER